MKIELLKVKEAHGESISNPEAVLALMHQEAAADRECIWILHLNTANKIIEKELAGMGDIASALVRPATVMRKAVINNTRAIIVIHNHPSGDPKASKDDQEVAARLKKAGGILGIQLLDFVVIATGGYVSFNEERIL